MDWLPAWTGDLNISSVVALVLLVIAAGWLAHRIWPGVRKLVKLADLLDGLPHFIARTDERMEALDHEMHPNHGTSIKDSVDRMERRLAEVSAKQVRILVEQKKTTERLNTTTDRLKRIEEAQNDNVKRDGDDDSAE